MSYNINKIFSVLEEDLIQKYKESMEKGIGSEEGWQMRKLQDLKKYREESRKIINKHTRRAMDEATGVIVDSYGKGMEHAEGLLVKTNKVLDDEAFGRLNRRKMDSLLDSVKNDFNKTSMATLRKIDDEYRQVVYKSQVAFSSGATTLRQSVDMASNDFLHKGINAIRYSNGNNVNIASYAEMVIRNSAKKAYLTGEGSKMAEWGEHLVQVTSYGGCSDTCLPWQGQVYFDDVFSGGTPPEDNKYPLLSMAMDEGLYHPNCRHTHNPYFEGISETPVEKTEEEIEEIRDNYQAEQQQRYNERKIREWKRVEEGSLDPDNQARASRKVSDWQARQRNHLESNPNLRRNYGNEKTYGIPNKPSMVAEPVSKIVEKVVSEPKLETDTVWKKDAYDQLLTHGRKTNTEGLLWLDSKGNKKFDIETGTNNSVKIGVDKVKFIRDAKPNSLVSIHNHPSSSSFSPADVSLMSKYESIKELVVIGHDNTEYTMSVGKGTRPNIEKITADYMKTRKDSMAEFRQMMIDTGDPDETQKQHSHHIMSVLAKEYGWVYRRKSL